MSNYNYEQICHRVREVAEMTGRYIAEQRKTFSSEMVENKGINNLVSYVDKQAERMIIDALDGLVDGALFVTEEQTVDSAIGLITPQSHTWVIDPLDGTTNFVHGMPPYAVSIALMKGETEVVVGVVHEVTIGESFYAWQGSKAYCNDRPIEVSKTQRLSESLIITGLAYETKGNTIANFVKLFDHFNRITHGTRRLGSAATDLVYIAAGRADGFYQANLSPWDVAAGALIVERAGGRVTDFEGGENYIFGKQIIATNQQLYNEFTQVLSK